MFDDLYTIIEEGKNQAVIKLHLDSVIFKVHFQGLPILPGACMTEICRELIERMTEKKLCIKNIKNVKFLQLISPIEDDEILFDINISELENKDLQAKINVSDILANRVFAKINMILGNVG